MAYRSDLLQRYCITSDSRHGDIHFYQDVNSNSYIGISLLLRDKIWTLQYSGKWQVAPNLLTAWACTARGMHSVGVHRMGIHSMGVLYVAVESVGVLGLGVHKNLYFQAYFLKMPVVFYCCVYAMLTSLRKEKIMYSSAQRKIEKRPWQKIW